MKHSVDSLFTKRYFTHDCSACPFWSNGTCSMVANCSTFQDLFSEGRFYSALTVAKSVTLDSDVPKYLQNGHFVDKNGFRISKIDMDGYYTLMEVINMPDIVGVLVPVETDN